ncbi:MAG: DUF6048 family protein [Bacteroidales bacterium]|jgi:hypothetical protein|nr:DUF6048 family protein [Bacteroidales bacterium]
MRKISGFFISAWLLIPLWSSAQDTTRYPINDMKGVRVGIDLSKLALPFIYNNRTGFEASLDMHIKGNFFAIAEGGWLKVDLTKSDENNNTIFHYRSNGYYGKLGIDYNLLKSRRPNSNDLLYAGFRYGMSAFSHEADEIIIPQQYWAAVPSQTIPRADLNAHWIEFLLGVKAEVLKNFYLGVAFRGKFLLSKPKDKKSHSKAYQIPGYGNGTSTFVIGMNYYVSYNIHF